MQLPVMQFNKFKVDKFYLFIGALVLLTIIVPATVVPKVASLRNSGSAASNSASYSTGWSNGFDINTDWETSWPDTGVTRTVRLFRRQAASRPWSLMRFAVYLDTDRGRPVYRRGRRGQGRNHADQR